MKNPATILFSCFLALSTVGVLPADDLFRDPGGFFPEVRKRSVWAGFGYLNARAEEIVYGGPGGKNGNEISHLTWDAKNALTFNLGYDGEINDRWSIFGKGTFSLGLDNSYMEDFDWLDPGNPNWSDLSRHPNTDLNHYVQLDLGADYKVIDAEKFTFLIRGAFRYTDIAFDAYGGNYIYSTNGFRDDVGVDPDHLSISYRQKMPGLYIGPRFDWALGCKLSMRMGALAGLTFNPSGRDRHWLRETIFEDNLDSRAMYGVNVGFDYALNPKTVFFIEGSYDTYKRTTGYTDIYAPEGVGVTEPGSAGGSLETIQVNAGVRINGWNKELFPNEKCRKKLF